MRENGTCSRVAAEIVRSQVIRVPTPFPTSTAHGGGLSHIGDLSGTDRLDATDRRGVRDRIGDPFFFFFGEGLPPSSGIGFGLLDILGGVLRGVPPITGWPSPESPCINEVITLKRSI